MSYNFTIESMLSENGKVYMPIPFNVWQVCGKKGMISTEVAINNYLFECKLIPKGDGYYYIPINKSVQKNISPCMEYNVEFEIIEQLSRINKNSPYSVENPIRKIDSISPIIYHKSNYCGQVSVAMIAGVTVEEVVQVMDAKAGQASMSKIIETLDYYGICHAEKMTYFKNKQVKFPQLCIITAKEDELSHYLVYYNGKYFDSSLGEIDCYNLSRVIGYLEVYI